MKNLIERERKMLINRKERETTKKVGRNLIEKEIMTTKVGKNLIEKITRKEKREINV